MFLKNRAVQMSFVKTEPDNTKKWDYTPIEQEEPAAFDPEKFAEIAKDVVAHAALTIGGVYVAARVLTTVCRLVETAAKARL